jgi:cysteine-rich repeat protein
MGSLRRVALFALSVLVFSLALTSCAAGGSDTQPPAGDDASTGDDSTGTGDANVGPFSIGGTVTGLMPGGGSVVLADDGGDMVTVSTDGPFIFAMKLMSGQSYDVTVATQPSATQTCVVTGGTGTVVAGDVMSIAINCSTTGYTIGGTIAGLTGTVVLADNAANPLTINSNGSFAFPTPLPAGTGYDVTVLTQPSGPTQSCTVGAGSGTVGTANVTNVVVTCSTSKFTVSAHVTGLAGTGLVLQDNGGDDLSVTADGLVTFATSIASGQMYDVTVSVPPSSPLQTCTVATGMGTVTNANVATAVVNCVTNAFTIGGTVSNLAGSGLVLQDNAADNLPVNADGSFTFPTPVPSGDMYDVTVLVQPSSPTQICTVVPMSASGTVGTANVTGVTISCVTQSFTVGGMVTGLAGTGLVLQDNDGDNLAIAMNESFTFVTPVVSGQPFAVSTFQPPSGPSQTCAVTNGSGTMGGANVTNVLVTCTTNKYTISGSVSGLVGTTSLVLQDNGADNLPVPTNGSFVFPTPIVSGSTYTVTVLTEPAANAHCVVTAGATGPVTNANITGVTVTCSVCGDGVLGVDEACDDGNAITNDACTNTCTLGPIVLGGSTQTYIASALTALGETFTTGGTASIAGPWPTASGVGTIILANDGYTGTLTDYTAHLAAGAHVLVVGGSTLAAYITWVNTYVATDPAVTAWSEVTCTNEWTRTVASSPTSTITQFLPATYNFTSDTITYHMTEFLGAASQPAGTVILGNTCAGTNPNVLATRRYASQGTFTYDAFDIGNYTDANSQAGYVEPFLKGMLLYLRSPH